MTVRIKLPKTTPSHRTAVIALYRALLGQTRQLAIRESHKDALYNVIRNRFRHSHPQRIALAKALRAGYTAIDLFDAAVDGDARSLAQIVNVVDRIPKHLKIRDGLRRKRVLKAKLAHSQLRQPLSPLPPEPLRLVNVFPRPLWSVQGERRVPRLVSANGIPMIRWKKPMPSRLGALLARLARSKTRRISAIQAQEEYYGKLATYEDEWDSNLMITKLRHHGIDIESDDFVQSNGSCESINVHTTENGPPRSNPTSQPTNDFSDSLFRIPVEQSFSSTSQDILQAITAEARSCASKQRIWVQRMNSIVDTEREYKAIEDAEAKLILNEGIVNKLWRLTRNWWTGTKHKHMTGKT